MMKPCFSITPALERSLGADVQHQLDLGIEYDSIVLMRSWCKKNGIDFGENRGVIQSAYFRVILNIRKGERY